MSRVDTVLKFSLSMSSIIFGITLALSLSMPRAARRRRLRQRVLNWSDDVQIWLWSRSGLQGRTWWMRLRLHATCVALPKRYFR